MESHFSQQEELFSVKSRFEGETFVTVLGRQGFHDCNCVRREMFCTICCHVLSVAGYLVAEEQFPMFGAAELAQLRRHAMPDIFNLQQSRDFLDDDRVIFECIPQDEQSSPATDYLEPPPRYREQKTKQSSSRIPSSGDDQFHRGSSE